jgi:hypothetical protein
MRFAAALVLLLCPLGTTHGQTLQMMGKGPAGPPGPVGPPGPQGPAAALAVEYRSDITTCTGLAQNLLCTVVVACPVDKVPVGIFCYLTGTPTGGTVAPIGSQVASPKAACIVEALSGPVTVGIAGTVACI